MKKSIVQTGDPRCFFCGRAFGLEKHHIFAGVANRPISDKYGLWVYLCSDCHRGVDGAQYNRQRGDSLKRLAQIAFEARHSHEEWMQLIRKNYL